jgi:site-specific DNA-methyltransferase (adenine-specific)
VKPIDLMRWLIRMVCPPGGVVLDPFLGSGSTGCAAELEPCVGEFIGIEQDPEYVTIAVARIGFWAEHGEEALEQFAEARAAERRRREVEDAGQIGLFE